MANILARLRTTQQQPPPVVPPEPPKPRVSEDISLDQGNVITLIASEADLDRAVEAMRTVPRVGLDVETTALDPRKGQLRLIQVALPDRCYVIDANQCGALASLRRFLMDATIQKVAHNATFELLWIACALAVPAANVACTMRMAQVLDAGLDVKASLEAVAGRYLNRIIDKSLQKSDWAGELTPDQLQYAATDARVALALFPVLEVKLKAADLDRVAELENDALMANVWLRVAGVRLDVDRWRDLVPPEEVKRDEAAAVLDSLVADLRLDGELLAPTGRWGSNKDVLAILQASGFNVGNTKQATLARFSPDPLIDGLRDYRSHAHTISTYGYGFTRHVDARTGRIYADWKTLGAVSGRMSCETPNLQGISKRADYRACFIAEPGHCLVKVDFNQAQLRIIAAMTKDPEMLKVYADDGDIHLRTAEAIMSHWSTLSADERKVARQTSKALNFGLAFGMREKTLQSHAKDFGVTLSDDEARAFRSTYLATYVGVKAWQDETERAMKCGIGETRSLAYCRRRLFPHRPEDNLTEYLASPVQASEADALKRALGLIAKYRQDIADCSLVLAVHDEIVLEAPIARGEEVGQWLAAVMTSAFEDAVPGVPPGTLTAQVGPTWAG
jgi:DNA polymerase I